MSKKSYVWDELSDEEETTHVTAAKLDHELDLKSVSSLGVESFVGTENNSLRTAAAELTAKVESLKEELARKIRSLKDLQSELMRLKTAQQRRRDKFKVSWEGKLREQRENHSEEIRKLSSFNDTIEAEVKDLRTKVEGLYQKIKEFESEREVMLEKAKVEVKRKKIRTRKQWEADEKTHFEKVVASKAEKLQEQAAQSFGPKLEKLVKESQDAINAKKDANTSFLQEQLKQLEIQLETQLSEYKEKLNQEMRGDLEKARRAAERRKDDQIRRFEGENEALRARESRERVQLETQHGRVIRSEQDTHEQEIQNQQRRESQQIADLLSKQQKELNHLAQIHADAYGSAQEKKLIEQEQRKKNSDLLNQRKKEQLLRRKKEQIENRAHRETQQILQKLREDAEINRKSVQKQIEQELIELRATAADKSNVYQEVEQNALSNIAKLKSEIDTFRFKLKNKETRRIVEVQSEESLELKELRQELRQLELIWHGDPLSNNEKNTKTRQSLSSSLRSLNDDFNASASLEDTFNSDDENISSSRLGLEQQLTRQLRLRRTRIEKEISKFQSEQSRLERALRDQEQSLTEKKLAIEKDYSAELTRIQGKINLLLKRKEDFNNQQSDVLLTLKQENEQLENQLERLREEKFDI